MHQRHKSLRRTVVMVVISFGALFVGGVVSPVSIGLAEESGSVKPLSLNGKWQRDEDRYPFYVFVSGNRVEIKPGGSEALCGILWEGEIDGTRIIGQVVHYCSARPAYRLRYPMELRVLDGGTRIRGIYILPQVSADDSSYEVFGTLEETLDLVKIQK